MLIILIKLRCRTMCSTWHSASKLFVASSLERASGTVFIKQEKRVYTKLQLNAMVIHRLPKHYGPRATSEIDLHSTMLATGMTSEDYISVSKDRRCLYPTKHHSSASPQIEQTRPAMLVEAPSKVREFLSFHSLQPTRKKSESNSFLAGLTTSFLLRSHHSMTSSSLTSTTSRRWSLASRMAQTSLL